MSSAHSNSTFPRWRKRIKRTELTPATLTYTFAEPTQADQAPAEKEKTRERSRQLLRRSSNASVAGSIHTISGMDRKQSKDALSVRSGFGDPTVNRDTASLRSVEQASSSLPEEPVLEAQNDVTEGDSSTAVTFEQPPAEERVPPPPAPASDIAISPNLTPAATAEAPPSMQPSQSAPAPLSENETPGELAVPDTSSQDTIRARSPKDAATNANAASSSWFQLFTWSREALPESDNPTHNTSADANVDSAASSQPQPQPQPQPHSHPHNPAEDMLSKGTTATPQPTEVDLTLTTAPSTTPRDIRLSASAIRPAHTSRPSLSSVPSSVDEEVPVLSPSVRFPPPTIGGPPTITHGQDASSGSGAQSTHTLNPSTSRFTLSIPLLGRPKVPLDKAVAAAQKEDIRDMKGGEAKLAAVEGKSQDEGSEMTKSSDDPKPPSSGDTQPEPGSSSLTAASATHLPPAPPNSKIVDASNSGPPAPSDPAPSTSTSVNSNLNTTNEPAEQSTWWNMFSWKSTSQDPVEPVTATTTSDTAVARATNSGGTTTTDNTDSHTSAAVPASPTSPGAKVEVPPAGNSQSQLQNQPQPDVSASGVDAEKERTAQGRERSSSAPPTSPVVDRKNPVDEGKLKAQEADVLSVLSVQSQQSQGAWYAPWAWYQSSSAPLPPAAEGGAGGDGQDKDATDKAEGGKGSETTSPSDADFSAQAQTTELRGGSASASAAKDKVQTPASAPDANAPTASPSDPSNSGSTAASSPASTSSQTQTRGGSAMQNPIEASASTSRSGWIAFFAARGAASKRITDGSEAQGKEGGKGEMEVMDLDLDEDENANDDAPAGASAGLVGGAGDGKDGKGTVKGARDDKATIKAKGKEKEETQASGSKLATPQVKSPRPGSPASQSQRPGSPAGSVLSDKDKSTLAPGTAKRKPTSSAAAADRTPSPSPSQKSSREKAKGEKDAPRPPNLILPTWEDTFHLPPRSIVPESYLKAKTVQQGKENSSLAMAKSAALKFVSNVIWAPHAGQDAAAAGHLRGATAGSGNGPGIGRAKGKGRAWEESLPRAYNVLEGNVEGTGSGDVLRGAKRVVVIGVHGWFPGAALRTVIGEPTGTSAKFTSMMTQALDLFQAEHGVQFEKITTMPLEGEGMIAKRVDRLYAALTGNKEWMDDLCEADVVFVATHSQGSAVSTHLLDRLIREGYIRTESNANSRPGGEADVAGGSGSVTQGGGADASLLGAASAAAGGAIGIVPTPWRGRGQPPQGLSGAVTEGGREKGREPHRVCCLSLCGIHHGPLRYLSTSSLLQPYIQYFESTAARELFEFQNTESAISKEYLAALQNILHHKVKMVYVASLNDQVVGLYSGLFTAVSHPLILRALYIDGDAYHSSDFLSNLLVLLLRIRNAGLSDSGLLTHLSEATAGSLNGIGHSTAYEEIATFSLAVNYLFLTDDGSRPGTQPSALPGHAGHVQGQAQEQAQNFAFTSEPFDALKEQNDYEIPWALRDLIADEDVARLFSDDFIRLRDAFRDWNPKTSILRDVKRKLQPIQRLSSAVLKASGSPSSPRESVSKL